MAQTLTKDDIIEVIAEIKGVETFDFLTKASKMKSVIQHFAKDPSSVHDKFSALTKKMDAFKEDDVSLEKMTEHDMNVFMDCMIHWVFAYKFICPEDIKLTISKKAM